MTAEEAKQARMDFVKNHSELLMSFESAHAPREAKLYADSRKIGQVVRQLHRILPSRRTPKRPRENDPLATKFLIDGGLQRPLPVNHGSEHITGMVEHRFIRVGEAIAER